MRTRTRWRTRALSGFWLWNKWHSVPCKFKSCSHSHSSVSESAPQEDVLLAVLQRHHRVDLGDLVTVQGMTLSNTGFKDWFRDSISPRDPFFLETELHDPASHPKSERQFTNSLGTPSPSNQRIPSQQADLCGRPNSKYWVAGAAWHHNKERCEQHVSGSRLRQPEVSISRERGSSQWCSNFMSIHIRIVKSFCKSPSDTNLK